MPSKKDQDSTAGLKLLRMFRKLMLDGRRHFQTDLAEEFQCSPQTIIRLAGEIESVIGANLESGLKNRRRWYKIQTIARSRLRMDFEELRYLSMCRDLSVSTLPEQIRHQVDDTISSLSVLMDDQGYAEREKVQQQQFAFFSKGKIDYTPYFQFIKSILQAADEQRICLVRYRALGKKEDKEHRFVPNRIISMNNALYAVGASLKEDFTTIHHFINFAVHRIKSVSLSERTFPIIIPEPDPMTFGLPWHEPRQLRVQFTPGKTADYVRERTWAVQQHMEETEDGGLILEITTCSEPELVAWVRGFGDDAHLL